MSSPRIKALRHRSPPSRPNERKECHHCYHLSKEDWEPKGDWEPHRRYYYPFQERCHSISPPVKVNRKIHRNHKFSILENWFKKFDFDGNGLLDVYEMKSLLNYLGVHAENSYVKELIESVDRDGDGMLSLSDFLYMWHQAAEKDMELYDVIREHALQPDIHTHREFRPPKQRADRNIQTYSFLVTVLLFWGLFAPCIGVPVYNGSSSLQSQTKEFRETIEVPTSNPCHQVLCGEEGCVTVAGLCSDFDSEVSATALSSNGRRTKRDASELLLFPIELVYLFLAIFGLIIVLLLILFCVGIAAGVEKVVITTREREASFVLPSIKEGQIKVTEAKTKAKTKVRVMVT